MARTVRTIIDDLNGPTAVAKVLELRPNAVQQWLVSGRIPRGRWIDLIEKFPGLITSDDLRAAEKVAA